MGRGGEGINVTRRLQAVPEKQLKIFFALYTFLKRCDCSVLRALSECIRGRKNNLYIFVNALRLLG